MVTYLDLLPNDILDIINDMLEKMYFDEHKSRLNDIHCELDSLWLIALWGAGYKPHNIVNQLYGKTNTERKTIVNNYDYFIAYLKNANM